MSFKKPNGVVSIPVVISVSLVSVFIIILPIDAGDSSCSLSGSFKENASDHVIVGYKTGRRGPKITKEVTRAVISWTPSDILVDTSCFDLEATELHIKRANRVGEWINSGVDAIFSVNVIKWEVDVKPCVKYGFAILVKVKDPEATLTLETTDNLGPASDDEINQSSYKPETPTNFTALNIKSESATLKWESSECATKYQIIWEEAAKEITQSSAFLETGGNKSETEISGLKPCTKYKAIICAIRGERYGEETSTAFTTMPELHAVSNLSVKIGERVTSLMVSWNTSDSIACIDEYKATACEVHNKDSCIGPKAIQETPLRAYFQEEIKGLRPCTNYTVTIQAQFSNRPLAYLNFPATTTGSEINCTIPGK